MQIQNPINRSASRTHLAAICAIFVLTGTACADVVLVGCTGNVSGVGPQPNSRLVDIDPLTGIASNPRDLGIKVLCGIAAHPFTGDLFGLTSFVSNPVSSLIRINPTSGTTTLVGSTGLPQLVEGDLAFNPLNGLLYGVQDTGALGSERNLFLINTVTGAASIVGNIGNQGDYSALAFDSAGTLWAIDSEGLQNSQLKSINPVTGQIVASIGMNVNLGSNAGLTFDPVTGIAYLGDNIASGGTNSLYTLDVTTGFATLIGATGDPVGLAGLAVIGVPEPSSLALLGIGLVAFQSLVRRRRAIST